ncbi:carbohydrate ABC transporter permease [Cohnella fermenti]|uniref:Sugar ABC transporter permease n=1 Tax=Cohnella fermenti TaxID=2565925 RepID=A0A4S4BP67_9BACL|nr:sugar ABC transporter permease [Cohnella fermenti]THF76701.1 sugar ABC transporter permease [Cohnella fermenti]
MSALAAVTSKKKAARFVGYAFVLPAVLFTAIFDYFPMLDGIWHSFYRWNGNNIEIFVGLGNFKEILSDSVFWTSVRNMLFFLVCNIVLMLPTLVASIVLFRIKHSRWQYAYRVLMCIPMFIPGIVIMLLWQFLYNPQYGFLNQLLASWGLENLQQLWLGDPAMVKWCLVFIGFPWIGSIALLIYLAGLQNLDSSIWDAAAIDGASPLQRALSIEIPLLKGQFKLNLISVLAGAVTGYNLQLVVTNGGPGFSTTVPGLYMYQHAFGSVNADYGYASAVGLLLFLIALLISLLSMKFIRSEE